MSAESTLEESLREEHRRRIAAELPSLGWVVTSSAILWFGLTGLVDDAPTRVPLPYRQVLAVFVFQSLVLVIASALARRDPTDRRVTAYAVGACTAVGLVWIWILTTTATVAAMLMFGTLMLFGAAPLVLAWRLGPQLTFQGTVTVAWIVALPSLARHVPRTELVAAIAFGNFLAVIATQWAVNAFHTEVFARLAALDFDRQMRASRDAYRALAENAVDFIWAIDLEGHWTYVNEALARR